MVLLCKTDDWELLSIEEILKIIEHVFKNEERIYPRSEGFKGSSLFLDEILKIYLRTKQS